MNGMTNNEKPISDLTVQDIWNHLRTWDEPFILKKEKKWPDANDISFHIKCYMWNPALYALCSLEREIFESQKVRILFQLLRGSRKDFSMETRKILNRVTAYLLTVIHPDEVLKVFLALKKIRANHKHTSKFILKYLLNHPHIGNLFKRRRASVKDCIEHSLGKNTARGWIKNFLSDDFNLEKTKSPLLKFTQNRQEAYKNLLYAFSKSEFPSNRRIAYESTYQNLELNFIKKKTRISKTITATNRGDISTTLFHIYRGGMNYELEKALEEYIEKEAKTLPVFTGKTAVILDASASTKGYGEREYTNISQSLALSMVIDKVFPNVYTIVSGGDDFPPQPSGMTDLAGPLIEALEKSPDVVIIISDGYENYLGKNLFNVIATLPQLGINTPVIFCHSKFSSKDDLSMRRPAPNTYETEFWHQDDFQDVFKFIISSVSSDGYSFLKKFYIDRLVDFEREMNSWIVLD